MIFDNIEFILGLIGVFISALSFWVLASCKNDELITKCRLKKFSLICIAIFEISFFMSWYGGAGFLGKTDFDRFLEDYFYNTTLIVNTLFLSSSIYLLLKKKSDDRWFYTLYLLFFIISFCVYYYFYTHMNHGQGA